MSSSIYLSGAEVREIAHYAHWIPAGRGFTSAFFARTYPEWSFNSTYSPLVKAGVIVRQHPREFSARHLVPGVIGVEINRRGQVLTDDGSSTSTARQESWDRRSGRRVSEHLALSTHFAEPTMIYLPAASRLIPEAFIHDTGMSRTRLRRLASINGDPNLIRLARLTASGHSDVAVAHETLSPIVLDGEIERSRPDWYERQRELLRASLRYVTSQSVAQHGSVTVLELRSIAGGPENGLLVTSDTTESGIRRIDITVNRTTIRNGKGRAQVARQLLALR